MGRNAKPEFRVRKSLRDNAGLKWFIIGRPGGKRVRAWFDCKEKAQAEATERNIQLRKLGQESVQVDNALITMAKEGATDLLPFNKTIRDAVNFYLTHLMKTSASVPFSALATQFRTETARRLAADEISSRHASTLSVGLHRLEGQFKERIVSDITINEVRDWLSALPIAPRSKTNNLKIGRQVFAFAVERGYTQVNPFTTIKPFLARVSVTNGKVHILTSGETSRLLEAADDLVIPFLALSFFAGVRRATLERLDWSDIRLAEKRLIVPGYKGKNQLRYDVTLSDNLVTWLTPFEQKTGSLLVTNGNGKPSTVTTRELILDAARKAGITLPPNAGRHTFISMHVAFHQNIPLTAMQANNSTDIIKQFYLDVVSHEEAAKYWEIISVVPERGDYTITGYDH